MSRLFFLLAVLALIASSCSDDPAGDSTDEFCALAVAQAAVDDGADGKAADLDPFLAAAPDAVRGDLQVIRDLLEKMEELEASGDDEAAFEAILSAGFDSEFTAANDHLEQFLSEECGLTDDDAG